jgi:hypothetical protein
MSAISLQTPVVAAPDQVSCDLSGEIVILNLSDGVYYGLDAVGARIWELLKEPRSVQEIRDIIIQEYDVNSDRCTNDLVSLLSEMASRSLIRIQDAPAR